MMLFYLISVPLEVKLLRREYFNRWYSLKAYYMALTIASLPLLVSSDLNNINYHGKKITKTSEN